MTFYDYVSGLSEQELESYATACGTSSKYILTHLRYGTRVPRKTLMDRLWRNAGGKLKEKDVFAHFYRKDEKAA